MTIRKMTLYIIMLWTVIIMAACAREAEINNGSTPENVETPALEEVPMKIASEKAEIVSNYDNSVLVTAYMDNGADSYIEAYSLRITDKTELLKRDGTAVTKTELTVGSQVEAWYHLPAQESYPMGADAAKLILLTDDQEPLNIDRSEAVRIALQAQTELAGPWAVKKAEMDAANEFWNVELVHFQHIDQPVIAHINGTTGETIPAIISENDAFRVFTPEPNTELGNLIMPYSLIWC